MWQIVKSHAKYCSPAVIQNQLRQTRQQEQGKYVQETHERLKTE